MKGFYRHIYFQDDKFQIIKNNEKLLSFDNIFDALAHRDAFESVGWDWDLYIEMEVDEKQYVNCELPPFSHDDLKYIYDESGKCRGKKPYSIKKRVNGKLKRFGRYKTLKEAISMRDELIANDWCDLKALKKKKRKSLWE